MEIGKTVEILESMTSVCRDNGTVFTESDRADVIASLLFETDYHLLFGGKLCFVYGKRNFQPGDEVVLISSHIDSVYKEYFCREDGDMIAGTFDNSLTNTAVVCNMFEGRFADNIIVAFTGDEEVDSEGALEVYRILRQAKLNVRFALVTDVTNEGAEQGLAVSAENDRGVGIFNGKKIADVLIGSYAGEYTCVSNAEPDESWDYNALNIPAMSLCIPVAGDLHSEGGVMLKTDVLPRYCDALADIANAVAQE